MVLDGVFRADLSDMSSIPAGVAVTSLARALTEAPTSDMLPTRFAGDDDSVLALNTALAGDGVLIALDAGAHVEQPLVLIVAVSGGQAQSAFTRSVLRVGDGASITIVEDSLSLREAATQSNDCLVVDLGPNATATLVARVDHPGAKSVHLHSLVVTQAQHSTLDTFCLVRDGGLVRRQAFVRVAGEHAATNLSGLSLLDRSRLADTTLVVDHAVPHGTSREFFRYILEGESTGVYQGKVIVRQYAQKTDGAMKSNALVLGEGAVMNNKPELEIFADDVVCGHGATVGQLDDDQLFYLMARGIPRPEAQALLVEAFGAQALDRIKDERLRDALLDDLRAWLLARANALSTASPT